MFTVYVVVAGLVAVVPSMDGAQNVIDILVLNAEGVRTDVGIPIEGHGGSVTFHDCQSRRIELGRDRVEEVEVRIGGEAGARRWKMDDAQRRVPDLSDFYTSVVFRNASVPIEVRPECLAGDITGCVDAYGERLLAARVRLTGGWTIAPLEVDHDGKLISLADESEYSLVSLGPYVPRFASLRPPPDGDPRFLDGRRSLAGGMLLSIAASSREKVDILRKTGGVWKAESFSGGYNCASFHQTEGDCMRIDIRNIPSYGGAYKGVTCDRMPFERVDLHFDRFYDLLVSPPVFRFLPLLETFDTEFCCAMRGSCGAAAGDPPGIKCFDTIITKAPQ